MDIHLPEKESEQAEKLFAEYGLTVEQAVALFIAQSLENGTLPFIPKIKPKNKLILDSNGKGALIVPNGAPEDFKDWVSAGVKFLSSTPYLLDDQLTNVISSKMFNECQIKYVKLTFLIIYSYNITTFMK